MSEPQRISAEDARLQVAKGEALLVCAYDDEERFQRSHLYGAISHAVLQSLVRNLPKDQEIIFYCSCPGDASAAGRAAEFQAQGFTNAMVLDGGIDAWVEAGYALL